MKSMRFRYGASRRSILFAIIGILALAAGGPGGALAEEGGAYTLQCFCPLEWSEDWDGAGVFNEDDSLDTVALTSDGAVLLIHEIPLEDGTLAGLVEERTESLERGAAISGLEEAWADETDEDALAGRVWENGEGDTMYGFQYVQVWEVNFLLSIEFIAPEADFVDAWDSLELVTLVGSPILGEFDGEEIAAEIAAGA